jgi:Tol biopolymer transport system component
MPTTSALLNTTAVCLLASFIPPTLAGDRGTTERVSVNSAEAQGNARSVGPAISADGRFVAFGSIATNLVRGDTNGTNDLFVRDQRTRTTTRESLGPGGVQSNGASPAISVPAISANGRFVAFDSAATNLVRNDTNAVPDIFVRDRQRGETIRASVRSDGAQANDASADPSISGDGRFVTFVSFASNLVPGDTNDVEDVFVRDLRLGRTSRVSLRADGGQGNDASGGPFNVISADGRFVAFISFASNLVPGDTNNTVDVFVRDRGKPHAP